MRNQAPTLKQLAVPQNSAGQPAQLQNAQPMQQGQNPKELLLSQLHDVATPEPVGYWPLAPGWWLLIALLLAAITGGIIGFFAWRNAKKRNKYRATAKRYLTALQKDYNRGEITASEALQQLNVLTKQAYFAAYPIARLTISGQCGEKWYQHLNNTLGKQSHDKWASLDKSIFEISYQPASALSENNSTSAVNKNLNHLFDFCMQWINHHPQLTAHAWKQLSNNQTTTNAITTTEAQHV